MKVTEALRSIHRIFLDTAPVIYFVEKNPQHMDVLLPIFRSVDEGVVTAITSPITLAECLVVPYRKEMTTLQQDFTDLLVYGHHTIFVPLDQECAQQAARLRAEYNISLPDAFQIGVAIVAGCDAFLTNDHTLQRVQEIPVIIIDELEL